MSCCGVQTGNLALISKVSVDLLFIGGTISQQVAFECSASGCAEFKLSRELASINEGIPSAIALSRIFMGLQIL